jgi:ubiquinone/menaquinone biosynthesis C-methylase UbiE
MDKIIDYYNNLADSYDDSRFNNSYGNYIDTQERKLLNKLLDNKGKVVLDLACGSGRLMNYANIGVDASSKMIAVSKKKFPDKVFYLSEANNIPLENNSIDTVIIFHFFMHLDQSKIDDILQECWRILKPNGRVIFDIPSKKRRQLLGFQSSNWHGAFSSTISKLNQNSSFILGQVFGILFLPIHRFPKFTRKFFNKIDLILGKSFLKEYSSYLMVEYKKIGSYSAAVQSNQRK